MIFLTGDIHHVSRRMQDQRLAPGWTEARICEPYLEIASRHSIIPTLFFTGLAVKREERVIVPLMQRFRFEIGGHTYSANRHRRTLAFSRRILKLSNGPYWMQRHDMMATIGEIEKRLGVSIRSWRNHAYRMDRNTYRIAAQLGLHQVSNVVSGLEANIRQVNGILEVPINTLPDHESLGHDSHPRRYSTAQDWVDRVLEQVEYQQSRGLPSVILAHPLCMFIEDRLAAFDRLCESLSQWPNGALSQCGELLPKREPILAHRN